jgi:CubicO group peptidase (beta-lactamase class C family)
MHEVMAQHVERGHAPGMVTLLSRRGELHVDTLGVQALGGAPMRRDTIFRISSMTKPVVAVAALILIEECRLRLDEPVDELLPELAERRVLRRLDGPLDDTLPASRPITQRDLLTFRVVTRRNEIAAVPGRFGWEGGLGTSWASDPREGLVGILLTQQAWGGPGSQQLWQDFWTSLYQAIDD